MPCGCIGCIMVNYCSWGTMQMGRGSLSASQSAIMPPGGVTLGSWRGHHLFLTSNLTSWGRPGLSPLLLHLQITPYLVQASITKKMEKPSRNMTKVNLFIAFRSVQTTLTRFALYGGWFGSKIAAQLLGINCPLTARPIAVQLFQNNTSHHRYRQKRQGEGWGGGRHPPPRFYITQIDLG